MLAQAIYTLAYVCTVLKTAVIPNRVQRECEEDALQRGWNIWIVRLTRSTQHFTMWAQLWLVLALLTEIRQVECVAMVLGLSVLALYYGFVYKDPTLLSYEDEDFTRMVASFIPPMNKYIVVSFCLWFQHFMCPLHLWLTADTVHEHLDIAWSMCAIAAYVKWNAFAWLVQGKPAYPVQQMILDKGLYDRAVWATYVLVFVTACVCDLVR